jgi:hypothetical protein
MSLQMSLAMNPQNVNLTRQARRLYVGNLPVSMGLTDAVLTQFFNATVISLGITTPQPVMSVWISGEGTFCFVEFRSIVDCTTCLQLLQGISLGGRTLRIGRPSEYAELPDQFKDYVVPLSQAVVNPNMVSDPALGLLGVGPTLPLLSTGLNTAPALPSATQQNSRVLSLEGMLTPQDLADDEEYEDIVLDFTEECELFGRVLNTVVPRSKDKPGYLKAFVKFETVDACKAAKAKLHGKKFSGKVVQANFFDEMRFDHKDYS